MNGKRSVSADGQVLYDNKRKRVRSISPSYFRRMPYFETIDNNQSGGSSMDSTTNSQKHPLFEEKSSHTHHVDRFSLHRHATEFVLNANHAEPDEAFRQAFEQLINRAIYNAEQHSEGRKVTKIGIAVNGHGN